MGRTPRHILDRIGDWAGWLVTTLLIVMLIAGLVAFVMGLAGCEALTPDWGGSGGGSGPKAEIPNQGGTFSATAAALWWMGLAATALGLVCLIAKVMGAAIMPSGMGVTAIVAGIPTMLAADVLAAHQWIAWVLLAVLVVVGIIELLGRKQIKRWLSSVKQTVTEQEPTA